MRDIGNDNPYAPACERSYFERVARFIKMAKTYDLGRTAEYNADATAETNLLEIDINRNIIHGIYRKKPYTITEIRKNI